MSEIVITTYDWVPEPPRGYVRDIRLRWALEEAGLPYRVESTSFRDRGPGHLERQPFGQVPWITDGGISVFESGAGLLHIAEKSELLMPKDPALRTEVVEWLFAALNSVEMASLPWSLFVFTGDETESRGKFDDFLANRLSRLEPVMAEREWLAGGRFTVADLIMAEVLRLPDRFDALGPYPSVKAYVDRMTARPAFRKAYDDQMAHFAD
ncbi:glutathione S-transferase family protein [Pelagovum pacificum]|uniref:Glutathione S-transferase family protein n=1 Tax=Pelagovum pacificum TaxID=2588711 RepID=A0A5C5GJT1_9RHOB|nr:glutathione S-transferase family protein [Pelagovum pacificum]QQA42791.1 glutathione S-transferase family protein [Pelagovum pacificum]TNY34061.1 glutathione S-transferase family protein [Pelagovum pacificum]